MPTLSDAKREKFAQLCARGVPTIDAYERAGFRRNTGNATTFRKKPEIARRVEELISVYGTKNEEDLAQYLHDEEVSPTFIIKNMLEVVSEAREAKKFDVALKGLRDVGNHLFGMFEEKQPNTGNQNKNDQNNQAAPALNIEGLNQALEGITLKRPDRVEIEGHAEVVKPARAIVSS